MYSKITIYPLRLTPQDCRDTDLFAGVISLLFPTFAGWESNIVFLIIRHIYNFEYFDQLFPFYADVALFTPEMTVLVISNFLDDKTDYCGGNAGPARKIGLLLLMLQVLFC